VDGAQEFIEEGKPIKYYRILAKKMANEEKVTLFVDFSHLLQFRFDDSVGFNFVTQVVKDYHRFEPFLRKALVQFMSDLGY